MKRRRNNIFLWCVLGFLLLLVISFVVLAFQMKYCQVNEIDLTTLIANQSGFYQLCVSAITNVFGVETLGLLMGGLFANLMFGFIVSFVFLAASLMIVWVSKMIVGSMRMRF